MPARCSARVLQQSGAAQPAPALEESRPPGARVVLHVLVAAQLIAAILICILRPRRCLLRFCRRGLILGVSLAGGARRPALLAALLRLLAPAASAPRRGGVRRRLHAVHHVLQPAQRRHVGNAVHGAAAPGLPGRLRRVQAPLGGGRLGHLAGHLAHAAAAPPVRVVLRALQRDGRQAVAEAQGFGVVGGDALRVRCNGGAAGGGSAGL